MRWPAAVLMAASLSACAGRTNTVDQRMIIPDTSARYEMAENQKFLWPVALDNDSPGFPDTITAKDLPPTTVCAQFEISSHGKVSHVVPLHDVEDCAIGPPAVVVALQDAVRSTLQQWQFDPAAICTYPDAQAASLAGDVCMEGQAERKPVAVTLAYAFTYEIRNGRRHVGRSRVGSH